MENINIIRKMFRESVRMRIALAAGICAVLAAGALFLYFHSPFQHPIPCVFYLMTGLYCPGCGAGRACYFILHGEFLKAFGYNPLMVIVLPFIGLYIVARGIDWTVTGGNHVDGKISAKFLLTVLVVILIYGVLRNIPAFPFTLLAPGGITAVLG